MIFVNTDGDNHSDDKGLTRKLLRESQERGDDVYFLFIAVSNDGSEFPFLDQIADEFDNTGVVKIADIRKFVQLSDEDINEMLLLPELITWLKR